MEKQIFTPDPQDSNAFQDFIEWEATALPAYRPTDAILAFLDECETQGIKLQNPDSK